MPEAVVPTAFAELGVRERFDLQGWITRNPRALGEDLLVLATEYRGFRESRRRIDMLALDPEGRLVVVELKREAFGSHADLQAIRYAAFCSTLRREQVVAALAESRGVGREEAERMICEFLGADDVPKFETEPRIILAAGAIDDLEITSSVLWLRRFQIDIRCVELTPYQLPDGQLIVVPKRIIPLPEAEEYLIRAEQKEGDRTRARAEGSAFRELRGDVAARFNALEPRFTCPGNSGKSYQKVPIGVGTIHYEWLVRRDPNRMHVSLHFEYPELAQSMAWLEHFRCREEEITKACGCEFGFRPFARNWMELTAAFPFEGPMPPDDVRQLAAATMARFIDVTWPVLEEELADRPRSRNHGV